MPPTWTLATGLSPGHQRLNANALQNISNSFVLPGVFPIRRRECVGPPTSRIN